MKIKTFGDVDTRALEQLKRCSQNAEYAVLCADHHVGYSQPIGGAIAYEDYISPSGVGYDIACGNKAVKTNIMACDIDVPKIMDEIFSRISFGIGRVNDEAVDHPVFDEIRKADFKPQRQLLDLARKQLGTVGSGNHYVDLFEDEEGILWVGVHFGSRGFGHKTATGFISLSQGKKFEEKSHEGEMDSEPILFSAHSQLGQDYIAAMELAGKYAYAGRDTVVAKVLEIMGAKNTYEVHNHHNFAWHEEHFGKKYWVVRKGCTPAFPNQEGFVGSTMKDVSVILMGVDSELSRESLYSTVHGAGRVMSRSEAAGKKKYKSIYECGNRDCDGFLPYRDLKQNEPKPKCPKCGAKTNKRKKMIQIKKGTVDWDTVRNNMKEAKIELRGAGADEAPEVYKNLEGVLYEHGETIQILHRLKPIGVAMAGEDIFDPYKD